MRVLKLLIFLAHWAVARAGRGKFWHISDLHLDPDYKVSEDPLKVCPSAGSQPVPNAGPWGDYLCDSPWVLINSSIYAMKEIEPKPDFILWTGDDTPHVPNENLGEAAVLEIVERLTKLIREVFPDTQVYAALGNHDFHPKSQLPAGSNNIYNQIAELWRPWLSNQSIALFREGAFYSEKLLGPSGAGRIVVLNTNLYYSNNEQTAGMADPGQQFQWLEDVLTNASRAGEMVYIIGHVPPGFFEKTRNKAWFREGFNEEYLKVVQKHHRVIAGQFFGHHHTDSFRMFYDDAGAPISVMFITPGVTPWKTTLPGVVNGANNPGIRVFEYDQATLSLQFLIGEMGLISTVTSSDSIRGCLPSIPGHGDLLREPEPGERAGGAQLGARVPGDRGLRGAQREHPLHARGTGPHRQRPGRAAALLCLQLGQLRHPGLRRGLPHRARVRAARGGLRRVLRLPARPRRRARAQARAPARGAAGPARAARAVTLGAARWHAEFVFPVVNGGSVTPRAGLFLLFPRRVNWDGTAGSGNEAPKTPPEAHFFHVLSEKQCSSCILFCALFLLICT
ncbi:acid sphingomyelinase-like phosphodiesterase 3b isoform X1 [Diceros bicornis minor]|uniref:acid sphingomyelinase-like phosphodiesterase 3b isoform X1 n=1 Tax=Diceros bicornis minor TaxID=77932 RepID=UPI0026EDBF1D|nr:acid sphingomyelinase-like phosphodiesterase 3b isoform X1 [Diceros bicornis minor]